MAKPNFHQLWDATPPIIDKELFDSVRQALKRRKEQRPVAPQREYLLTGHIICGDCGKPVVGSCLSHCHRYYRCRATRPTAAQGQTCYSRYIRADCIE